MTSTTATEIQTDGGPDTMVLLVVTDQTTAVRYTSWLTLTHSTRLVTGGCAGLDAIEGGFDVDVLTCALRHLEPPEFLARVRSAGFDGKVMSIDNSRPSATVDDSGFDRVLSKPVAKSTLVETVGRLLRRVKYDHYLEQYRSLVGLRTRWEAEMTDHELNAHDRYTTLVARLNRLEGKLDDLLEGMDAADFDALFREVCR